MSAKYIACREQSRQLQLRMSVVIIWVSCLEPHLSAPAGMWLGQLPAYMMLKRDQDQNIRDLMVSNVLGQNINW